MTISYGITALNELQRLYNGKSIREDGEFALEVMQYIQNYIDRIKEEEMQKRIAEEKAELERKKALKAAKKNNK